MESPRLSADERALKELLEKEALRINRPEFVKDDPVQFPRRFSDMRDIEIAALLSAILAWGNRKMICRDCSRLLSLMENRPYDFISGKAYEEIPPELNIHRTIFARDMQWLMRGLSRIYSRFGSLNAFSAHIHAGLSEAPAWTLAEALNQECIEANRGEGCPRCLPQNMTTTALKRVNMALRWLVRDDGIVDIGIWDSIPKSKLFIPLDVHVGNTARELGLLSRKSNDRRAATQLTETLRRFRADDPAWFDFALFGIGIGKRNKNN